MPESSLHRTIAETKNQRQQPDSPEQSQPAGSPLGAEITLRQSYAAAQRARLDPTRLMPRDVMALQRTMGNRALAQLLGRDAQSRQHQAGHAIQRRANPVGAQGGPVDSNLERSIQHAQSGGTALSSTMRRTLEPKLNADLSGVKIHTGSESAQLNRDLGAKAFTHKNHIFYGEGQSPNDVQLTAHEAVHTVQQGAISTGTLQRKGTERGTVDPAAAKQKVPDDADRYTLTLAVWQDDPNFLWKSTKFVVKKGIHQLFGTKNKPEAPTSTGHSWVELRAFKKSGEGPAEPSGKKSKSKAKNKSGGKTGTKSGETSDIQVFTDSYGFGPGGIRNPEPFHGDSGENVLYRDYNIGKEKFLNVIATAEAIAKENPDYNVLGMNCTKFARALVLAAGLSFMGNRVVPGAKIGPGKPFTPNRLYSAMESKHKKGKAYKLKETRRDHPLHAVPAAAVEEIKPLKVYMKPELDTSLTFEFTSPTTIRSYRVSDLDPGWTEILVAGDDEKFYVRTAEFKAFLADADRRAHRRSVDLPFSDDTTMALKTYFEWDSEWEMIENQYGYTRETFTALSDKQVAYLALLWEMPVDVLKKKFAS